MTAFETALLISTSDHLEGTLTSICFPIVHEYWLYFLNTLGYQPTLLQSLSRQLLIPVMLMTLFGVIVLEPFLSIGRE